MKDFFLRSIFILLFFFLLNQSCKKHKFYRKDNGFENDINFKAGFVVNGKENSLSVIELEDYKVVETRKLFGSEYPHHIYLSPDKSMFAISFANTDLSSGHLGHSHSEDNKTTVQIFKTTSGEHVTNICVKHLPHNAIFSPDGSELWIGQSGSESFIQVISVKKWKKDSKLVCEKGLSEVTFSKDGSKAYAANTESGTISIFSTSEKKLLCVLKIGEGPVGAWPAENGKMYVDNEVSQTISEVDVGTDKITSQINLGFKPGYAAFSNGELWVSDATNGGVVYYSYNGNSWELKGSITTGADAHAIAFTASGSIAFVSNQGDKSVSVIDAINHTLIKNVKVGDKPNGIALFE